MRISDWSSDVCSSDLAGAGAHIEKVLAGRERGVPENLLGRLPHQIRQRPAGKMTVALAGLIPFAPSRGAVFLVAARTHSGFPGAVHEHCPVAVPPSRSNNRLALR